MNEKALLMDSKQIEKDKKVKGSCQIVIMLVYIIHFLESELPETENSKAGIFLYFMQLCLCVYILVVPSEKTSTVSYMKLMISINWL